MPLYRYRAVDDLGNVRTGTMEEASARRVAAILREQGLTVNSVEEAGLRPDFPRLKSSLRWEDIALLNDHLAAITRSKLPLAPALRAVAEHIRKPYVTRILDDVRQALENGATLTEALDRHAAAFPPVYLAIIRAGEQTGNLPAVLDHFNTYATHMVELKTRARETLVYPIVVLFVSVGVLGLLFLRILPEFEKVYGDFGVQLPALTLFWISVSHFLRAHYGIALATVGVLAAGAVLLGRTAGGRYVLDWLKLRAFGLRTLTLTAGLARYTRTLAVLLGGKVPLADSLRLAAASMGNAVMEEAALEVVSAVETGQPLSRSYEAAGYFGRLFCWLVSVGEERGEIDQTIKELADTSEQRYRHYGWVYLNALPPALIVVLAVIVSSVIISIYLPIFTLADAISR